MDSPGNPAPKISYVRGGTPKTDPPPFGPQTGRAPLPVSYQPPLPDPYQPPPPASYPVSATPPPVWSATPQVVSPPQTFTLGVMPVAVRTAYLALLTAAALAVVAAGVAVYGIIELRDSANKLFHLDPSGTVNFYAADYADEAQYFVSILVVVFGLLFALAYAAVARAIRKGRHWPRPVGTVLAVISLPAVLAGPVLILSVIAGFVAVTALWTPGARGYATAARSQRLQRRAR